MARSKPTDSPAPSGKVGRSPAGGGAHGGAGSKSAGSKGAQGKGAGGKGAGSTGAARGATAAKVGRKGAGWGARLKKAGGQLKLIGQAYSLTRKNDPRLPWILLGTFVLVAAVVEGIALAFGAPFIAIPFAILLGLMVALMVFSRRVQSSHYRQVENQPGAAAWALETMRGDWRVTSGVAGTPQFDAVHRVLGRPGIVLVAEGSPARVRQLLAQEKKKIARVVGDTPIYDVVVGDGEGQVPLRKLSAHVMKLPRNLSGGEVNALGRRMDALGGPRMPVPGGPLPGGRQMSISQRQVRRR